MATLRFDATNDYLASSAAAGLNGAFSLAVLYQRVGAISGTHALFSTTSSTPSSGFVLEYGSLPHVYNDNAGNQTSPSGGAPGPLSTDDNDLRIIAVTRGSGETPRFHMLNVTDAGSWAHGDGTTAQTTNPDAATGAVEIGRFNLVGTGIFDFLGADVGLVGWWDGTEFTAGQVEALSTNLATSDWADHATSAPSSLTELTSSTPTDLEGLVTWTNNGATLSGDNMALWDFDGAGGSVAPTVLRSRRMMLS
jgi:hypothetical protein